MITCHFCGSEIHTNGTSIKIAPDEAVGKGAETWYLCEDCNPGITQSIVRLDEGDDSETGDQNEAPQ